MDPNDLFNEVARRARSDSYSGVHEHAEHQVEREARSLDTSESLKSSASADAKTKRSKNADSGNQATVSSETMYSKPMLSETGARSADPDRSDELAFSREATRGDHGATREDQARSESRSFGAASGNPKRDTLRRAVADPVHRYRDQSAYRAAAGRDAPRERVYDTRDFRSEMAVVDLRHEQPSYAEFYAKIRRELLIRNYKRKSVKSYLNAVSSFLRWSGRQPHEVDREMVREYLLYLVESDKGYALVRVHSTAIRTVFDKFCFLDITLGLETPRRNKKQPVVLSKQEMQRLLEAAPTMRDKLILGLMYATGMRVSEVVRVRWREIDLDRNTISIVQGKGNVDRQVMLPETYRAMFSALQPQFDGAEFLFPAEAVPGRRSNGDRHLSPRTAQRVMKRAVAIAGIRKEATPHSLRHSFATHSFEDGCDIRRIQKVLGHVRLETTTIYVHIAKPTEPSQMPSPIDRLCGTREASDVDSNPLLKRAVSKGTGAKGTLSKSNPSKNAMSVTTDRTGGQNAHVPASGRTSHGGGAFSPGADCDRSSHGADRTQSSQNADRTRGNGDRLGNTDPVGKLSGSDRLPGFDEQPRIHVKRFEGEESVRITVEVVGGERRVFLLGIRASESRPGFWTLSVPLMEAWESETARLSAAQRRAIAEPEFYEFLRTAITNRLRQGDLPSEPARSRSDTPEQGKSETPVALSGALAREGNSQHAVDRRVQPGEVREAKIRFHVARSA
ncbi:tyrosine-type recombinase/integrase [Rhodopirellula sallentina]|uniref:tyrosine-type recombinase/integrase n=1 Tax=Rhodopirellula sallentina TaxID=1263869 RepID=UPI00069391B9|nr:tyrosine-type recombinase/integrase [Rhodopirellula sallentina]